LFQKEQSSTASIFHIIESSLNEAGMTNKHLYAGLELALIPGLSLLRRCLCSEHSCLDTGLAQD